MIGDVQFKDDAAPSGRVDGAQDCRPSKYQAFAAYGILFGILIFAYAPVLTTNYFFYDDYVQLINNGVPFSQVLPIYLAQYRPGFTVWLRLASNNEATLLNSAAVRFAGVIGLALLCYMIYAWMRSRKFDRSRSFFLSLIICTTPAFQSAMGYISAVVSVYCCLFSALSAVIVIKSWASAGTSRRMKCFAVGCGILLVAMAVGTYQPPAMFCWVIVALAVCAPEIPDWQLLRRAVLVFMGTFVLGTGGIILLSKALIAWLHIPAFGRTALLSNVPEIVEKIHWYASVVVPNAFVRMPYAWSPDLLPTISKGSLIIGLLLVLATMGPFLYWKKQSHWAFSAQQMASMPVFLLLAYFPFLPIKENSLLTVYLTALQPMLVVLSVYGADCLWATASRVLKGTARIKAVTACLALLAIISVYTCNRNMLDVYVLPNVLEYRYVKGILSHTDLSGVSQIHIKGHLNFSGVLTYSERLVFIVLNELKPGHPIQITSSSSEAPIVIHEEIMARNPSLLRPAYSMTAHGYYMLREDLNAQKKEALQKYFGSLSDVYQKQGALVIDMKFLRDAVGTWNGML
jgi:hypothetical protein